MPRQPRFILPGYPQHVIQRGNNRCAMFVESKDYELYSEQLYEACLAHHCHIHAYVWMTNHIHMIITPLSDDGISKVMQSVGRRYVQYFNKTYQRTGTLWEGRYKATIVDSESYLLACYRYIELNPVRANMVEHPNQYAWSSYHHNAEGNTDRLIQPHDQYIALGNDDKSRQHAYREMFNQQLTKKFLKDIRETTQKGWAFGNTHFKTKLEETISRQISPLPRGGIRTNKT